jgi:lipopolysaccharide export LptBFGC system permease protein LptF
MEDRLAPIETDLATVKADVASIRAHGATREDLAVLRENAATRQDLAKVRDELAGVSASIAKSESRIHEAMNAQTWRYVTWTSSLMAMMVAAVYFIARNVH